MASAPNFFKFVPQLELRRLRPSLTPCVSDNCTLYCVIVRASSGEFSSRRTPGCAKQHTTSTLWRPALGRSLEACSCPCPCVMKTTCGSALTAIALAVQKLAVHKSLVHGQKANSAYAAGAACQVCHTYWWSTARLRQHVWRSPRCAAAYGHADLDEPHGLGSRKELAWRPPVPTFGPPT